MIRAAAWPILAFPQQMAAVGPLLNDLLKRVFTTTGFDNQILLRGVYFTSGTQEGTPVDRVLGAVARAFGVTSHVAPAAAGRGKAYFIERLLKNVVFRESGLAGINRRLQLLKIVLGARRTSPAPRILVLGVLGLGSAIRPTPDTSPSGRGREVARRDQAGDRQRRRCRPKRFYRGSTRCERCRIPRTST